MAIVRPLYDKVCQLPERRDSGIWKARTPYGVTGFIPASTEKLGVNREEHVYGRKKEREKRDTSSDRENPTERQFKTPCYHSRRQPYAKPHNNFPEVMIGVFPKALALLGELLSWKIPDFNVWIGLLETSPAKCIDPQG